MFTDRFMVAPPLHLRALVSAPLTKKLYACEPAVVAIPGSRTAAAPILRNHVKPNYFFPWRAGVSHKISGGRGATLLQKTHKRSHPADIQYDSASSLARMSSRRGDQWKSRRL